MIIQREDNKALIRGFYQEIDNGNLDAMDELVAENYLGHSPSPFPGSAPPATTWCPADAAMNGYARRLTIQDRHERVKSAVTPARAFVAPR
ncbi:MAG TPA: hypothetical protein VHZ03_35205 [Trebonia sp.]|nr:hypothetical protein [Trebonia sp.]